MKFAGIIFSGLSFALLAGCNAPPLIDERPAQADISPSSLAFYPSYPEALLVGLLSYCDDPARRIERLSPTHLRCHQLLDPETTAGIILAHNGILEDLPTLIGGISIASGEVSGTTGYIVQFSTFINVPQKQGRALEVTYQSRRITRAFRTMLRATGGQELTSPSN